VGRARQRRRANPETESASDRKQNRVATSGLGKAPDKRNAEGDYIVGIDNIYLKTERPAEFYQKVKPMLNVGGMMHYPRGEGGMVLMNILFKDTEAVPINVQKKRTIFATGFA
jgi:hypothetical protein